MQRISNQLEKMKPGKAADQNGIVAELLRNGSELFLQTVASLFTDVLQPAATVLDYWQASSIRVIFKKGDERLPRNYRPICIVPILY